MYTYMHAWKNHGSEYTWMNEWMKWMNEMNEWMSEWMNEGMNEWMNKWMNEGINERINEWMNIYAYVGIYFIQSSTS